MSAVASTSSVAPLVSLGQQPAWQVAWAAFKRRVRTAWRPLSVTLRPGPSTREAGDFVPSHAAALADWRLWCQARAGSHCHVALSAHWVLGFAAPEDQVALSWERYFGLSPAILAEQWLVRSTPGSDGVVVVCAVPRALVQDLQAVAREHGVKVQWMGPWWAPELQAWLRPATAAGEGGEQTDQWAGREPGLVTHAQRPALPEGGHGSDLSRVWSEVLDLDGADPVTPSMLAESSTGSGLARPAASPLVDRLDFVGPRVRTALWSWALLVLGLAVAVAVADQAQQAFKSQDDARQTLGRLERAHHQQQLARAAPRAAREASASASSVIGGTALHQASGMVQLLAFPWMEVIGHVEQAAFQEQAVLTAFSLDLGALEGKAGARPLARLVLAVPDDAAALRWLSTQGEDAQLLSRQLLSTPFDTANGHYALRYEAAWMVDPAAWRGHP